MGWRQAVFLLPKIPRKGCHVVFRPCGAEDKGQGFKVRVGVAFKKSVDKEKCERKGQGGSFGKQALLGSSSLCPITSP